MGYEPSFGNRQVEHDPILFKWIVLPPRGDAAASAQAQWPCAQRNGDSIGRAL